MPVKPHYKISAFSVRQRQQRGQSMVEFALILPILIILTIGAIYLTLNFTHKSRMNGLAFMQARMLSVQAKNFTSEEALNFVKKQYAKQAQINENQSWISDLKLKTSNHTGARVEISLEMPSDPTSPQGGSTWQILGNAIDIVGGGGSYNPRNITAQMRLPRENQAEKEAHRPETKSTVSYRIAVKPPSELPPWQDLPKEIFKQTLTFSQMADDNRNVGVQPENTALKAKYEDWGFDYASHSEKEGGEFTVYRELGEHFDLVSKGGLILDVVGKVTPIGNAIKSIVSVVGEEVLKSAEQSLSQVSNEMNRHVTTDFLGAGTESPGDGS